MEIWCECFGKMRQNLMHIDSYEIKGILSRIGGVKKFVQQQNWKARSPHYGQQKTFVLEE